MEQKSLAEIIKTSLTYMLKDNKFINKYAALFIMTILCVISQFLSDDTQNISLLLVYMILCLISFLASIFYYGYMSAGVKALSEQDSNFMLPFFNFKAHGILGLKWLAASLIFGVALFIACILLAIVIAIIAAISQPVGLILCIIAGIAFVLVAGIYYMAFFRMFAVTQDILAFFRIKEIFASVRQNEKLYAKHFITAILLGVLVVAAIIVFAVISSVALPLMAINTVLGKIIFAVILGALGAYYNMSFMYLCAKCVR